MILWILLILLVTVAVHEAGHKLAFRRSGLVKHERNRLDRLRELLETFSTSKVAKLPTLKTLDYWKTPASAPKAQTLRIALAGPAAGFVVAWVVFTILAFTGMPELFNDQYRFNEDATELSDELLVTAIDTDSDAYANGVRPNENVITIGTEHVRSPEHFAELNQHFEGDYALLVTESTGESGVNVLIDPEQGSGVSVQQLTVNRYGLAAPFVGLVTAVQVAWLSFIGLFNGDVGLSGVFDVFSSAHFFGFRYIFFVLAYVMSIYSFINLLPIKPFDLGRHLFRGKKPLRRFMSRLNRAFRRSQT